MTRYFKETFALSDKGAKDMVSAIAAVVMQNMALMAPVSLLYLFTGDCLQGIRLFTRTGMYVGGIGICLALIAAASIWQYDTTYRATYTESATRRISLAEKLRKLPLSFFAKKDLADLTSTIMSDAEAMEHAGSHMIPQFYGSMISTMILSIGLCFFQWRMALAAVWPIPISLFIVLTSKRVQNHFSRTQQQAKIDLADHVQEYIETLPSSGSKKRRIRFATVVLPLPDGPTKATIRSLSTRIERWLTAASASFTYRYVTSRSSTETIRGGTFAGPWGSGAMARIVRTRMTASLIFMPFSARNITRCIVVERRGEKMT